jgi:hypothetical protein
MKKSTSADLNCEKLRAEMLQELEYSRDLLKRLIFRMRRVHLGTQTTQWQVIKLDKLIDKVKDFQSQESKTNPLKNQES